MSLSRGAIIAASTSSAAGWDHSATLAWAIPASGTTLSHHAGFTRGLGCQSGEVPFYELPTLGNSEGLRGYRRNRFVGEGYFYYNTELRSPVAIWRNPIIPVVLGIRGFFDSGFVTQSGVDNPTFKHAYGGGIYLIPLSRSYTISLLC